MHNYMHYYNAITSIIIIIIIVFNHITVVHVYLYPSGFMTVKM